VEVDDEPLAFSVLEDDGSSSKDSGVVEVKGHDRDISERLDSYVRRLDMEVGRLRLLRPRSLKDAREDFFYLALAIGALNHARRLGEEDGRVFRKAGAKRLPIQIPERNQKTFYRSVELAHMDSILKQKEAAST